MHTETIAALVRSHKRILRCEAHLAVIHRRLEATSGVVAKALMIVQAGDGEDASSWPEARRAAGLLSPNKQESP